MANKKRPQTKRNQAAKAKAKSHEDAQQTAATAAFLHAFGGGEQRVKEFNTAKAKMKKTAKRTSGKSTGGRSGRK